MIKILTALFFLGISFYCLSNETISYELKKQGYGDLTIKLINEAVKNKPNFDTDKYVISYGCGGGAICGFIFDSKNNKITNWPDNYVVDDYDDKYSLDSNEFCIKGKSATNIEEFMSKNKPKFKCYIFLNNKLKMK